jgi:putative PIN family toxin of toxin-antitoxin system
LKPAVVLDTNVVLDWLVFRNAEGRPLFEAIERRELRWIVTQSMRDELIHVLGRGVAAAYSPNLQKIAESWHELSEVVAVPAPQGDAMRLRCTDPDDQKFIDLALAEARWLVSRDRAVLKLARRAEQLGLRVVPPGRWQPTPT